MNAIFAILITIASLLLILVVLIQKSKGGGLAANVSSYNQFAGVRKTTDFVEKATWGLAIFIFVLSVLACILTSKVVANQQAPIDFQTPVEQTEGTPVNTPTAPAQK